MEIGGEVGAQQAEEGGDGKCLVAVADDSEIDAVLVIVEGEEGDGSVDGDHEENADNVSLFMWARVVRRVHGDKEEGDRQCDEGEDGRQL